MFPKRFSVVLLAFLSFFTFRAEAYLEPLSPQSFNALYNLAANGDVSAINNARSRGLDIDSVNANGDTGLCVAAKRKNKKAFKSFLQSGANPSHRCTWEIDDYRDFLRSVIQKPVRNMDTAVGSAQKLAAGSTGMSFTTKALIGAGIVAAGAGTAIALSGGGGGGGGNSVDPNCVHGHWVNETCVCNSEAYTGSKCDQCATGYDHYGTNECYKTLACAHGGVQKGAKCVCPTAYNDGNLCEGCGAGYGKDSTGACVSIKPDVYGDDSNVNYNYLSSIDIVNNDYANVYGLFYDAGQTIHWHYLEQTKFANTYFKITKEDIEVEVEKEKEGGETETVTEKISYGALDQHHQINITNHSDGRVYGLYSNNAETVYNNYIELQDAAIIVRGTSSETERNQPGISEAYITLNNTGDGDVFGIWGNGEIISGDFNFDSAKENSAAYLYSYINVNNNGAGNAYGIYNYAGGGTDSEKTYSISNTYKDVNDSTKENSFLLQSFINVTNTGKGNAYGMHINKGTINNSGEVHVTATSGNAYAASVNGGTVNNIKNYNELTPSEALFATSTSGNAYGIIATGGEINNGRWISATSVSGNAYGIYFTASETSSGSSSQSAANTVTNSSKITASSNTGSAFGIYNIGGTVINSTQHYPISVESVSGTAVGIYSNGGSVENTGRIWVYGPSDKTYGIYATNGAKVKNSGQFEFVINGDELKYTSETACTGDITSSCYTPGGGKAIYLTGNATLLNAGSVSTSKALSLGSSGVSITSGGNFTAPAVSGNLSIDNEVVSAGFKNTYVLENAVNTDDATDLTLSSASPLFNASLEGSDIVLTKKDFAQVVDAHSSVGTFLNQNYALENGESFFKDLKEKTNLQSVQETVNGLTGQTVLSRFSTEDLLIDKDLNFDISDKMFHFEGSGFSFADDLSAPLLSGKASHTRYALSGSKNENTSFGVGMSVSDINTADKHAKNDRSLRHIQLMAPFEANKKGFKFLSTPKIGYAYGTYNREGFNQTNYEGKIKKRTASLSNELRYPVRVGAFEISPAGALNFGMYQTKLKEDAKAYSLSSKNNQTYSVETAIGAYLSTQKEFSKTNRFQFMAGALLCHEYANPYELTLSMNSMDGQFKITDDKRRSDYVVLRSKLSYDFGSASVSAGLLTYIDSEYRTRADLSFKYAF